MFWVTSVSSRPLARGRPGPGDRRWVRSPTSVTSAGCARSDDAPRDRPDTPRSWPPSPPRGSLSRAPLAHGSPGCPSPSRCRPPSARRCAEPVEEPQARGSRGRHGWSVARSGDPRAMLTPGTGRTVSRQSTGRQSERRRLGSSRRTDRTGPPHTATGKLRRSGRARHRAWRRLQGSAGRTAAMPFATVNPATGQTEKEFPPHTPDEVDALLHRGRGRLRRLPDDDLRRTGPPPDHGGRAARGRGAGRGPDPHHRDGQDLRRGQGRGLQVRGRAALVRRPRRGAAGRRARDHGGVEVLRALPAARCGAGRHAVELPAVAGHPLRRAGADGRQRRPAEARVERAADRRWPSRTCSAGPACPTACSPTSSSSRSTSRRSSTTRASPRSR